MMPARHHAAAYGAVLALAACYTPDIPIDEMGFQQRDSSGVRIAVNVIPDPAGVPRWRTDPVPALEVIAGTEVPEGFGGVQELVRLPDSRVVLSDFASRRVLVYGADGRFQRAFGGMGTAPGEFRNMQGLTITPDGNVALVDLAQSRVTFLSPDTGLAGARLVNFGELLANVRPGLVARQGVALAESLLAVEAFEGRSGSTRNPAAERTVSHHLIVTGSRITVFSLGPYQEGEPLRTAVGNRSITTRAPLSPRALFAVHPGGTRVCSTLTTLRMADCVSADGRRISIRWTGHDVPVDTLFRRLWTERFVTEQGALHGISTDDALRLAATTLWPTHFTPIEGITLDTSGNLWVLERVADNETPTGNSLRYRVFDPGGRLTAFADYIPLQPVFLEASRMTGIATGADGARVVEHNLIR